MLIVRFTVKLDEQYSESITPEVNGDAVQKFTDFMNTNTRTSLLRTILQYAKDHPSSRGAFKINLKPPDKRGDASLIAGGTLNDFVKYMSLNSKTKLLRTLLAFARDNPLSMADLKAHLMSSDEEVEALLSALLRSEKEQSKLRREQKKKKKLKSPTLSIGNASMEQLQYTLLQFLKKHSSIIPMIEKELRTMDNGGGHVDAASATDCSIDTAKATPRKMTGTVARMF